MQPEVKINKLAWADGLRLYAACSVLLLHVAATGVLAYGKVSPSNWWTCTIYDSGVRSCVPLFVMLTGALILPSERPLEDYLKKRVTRIILPFAFWSLVYIAYHYFNHDAGAPVGLVPTLKWIYGKLQVGAEFHFWYVYMILGVYLFAPILGKWCRAATEQELLYFLVIWSFTLFANIPVFSKYGIRIDLTYFGGYIGYAVLGYYISVNKTATKKWLAIITISAGYLITLLGTYWLTAQNGHFIEQFYNPLTPNVALMAAGTFYLFRHASLPPITGLLAVIKDNSYTIYLSHILVLSVLKDWGITEFIIHPAVGIPLLSLLCLAICVLIAIGIKKSFLGKYIAG
jgi:surface polysaccharide O-acyltransferase-like enzyme